MAQASSHEAHEPGGKKSVRCADAGHPECEWEATGHDDEEVMRKVERHVREQHEMASLTPAQREHVRRRIRSA